jgi:hypothetical protein
MHPELANSRELIIFNNCGGFLTVTPDKLSLLYWKVILPCFGKITNFQKYINPVSLRNQAYKSCKSSHTYKIAIFELQIIKLNLTHNSQILPNI